MTRRPSAARHVALRGPAVAGGVVAEVVLARAAGLRIAAAWKLAAPGEAWTGDARGLPPGAEAEELIAPLRSAAAGPNAATAERARGTLSRLRESPAGDRAPR